VNLEGNCVLLILFFLNLLGTRHLGDLIMHYYNIDMSLSNKKSRVLPTTLDTSLDKMSNALDFFMNKNILTHHDTNCDCNESVDKCVTFYQRFCIHGRIFHSTSYKKRGLCNSYAVQYLQENASKSLKYFGEIIVFFSNRKDSFALLQTFENQKMLSEYFKLSQFYENIEQPINAFYHVVKRANRFVCVPVKNIIKHCIVFTKNSSDSLIITPVSSYVEHD